MDVIIALDWRTTSSDKRSIHSLLRRDVIWAARQSARPEKQQLDLAFTFQMLLFQTFFTSRTLKLNLWNMKIFCYNWEFCIKIFHCYLVVLKFETSDFNQKYLNEILYEGRPPGELVGLLTDSFLTVRFLCFLSGCLWRNMAGLSERM